MGPFFGRIVFNLKKRKVKRRGRTLARFEDVARFRLVEYLTPYEELMGINPEVQKRPRPAELWLDLKDGTSHLLLESEQAGLLLAEVGPVTGEAGLPLESVRLPLGGPSDRSKGATPSAEVPGKLTTSA
jgi:hypothetical protein